MRVVRVPVFGGAEVLKVMDEENVDPASAEVTVQVQAAGVGMVDVLQRCGFYPGTAENFVPGLEVAGVVTALGPHTPAEYLGKRIYAKIEGGGYADRVNVPASRVVALPDCVNAIAAVALGINAAVAVRACERVGVEAGKRVLVRGAGGGIGVYAVQAATAHGAEVVAVTSSTRRAERLRALGASNVFDRTIGGVLEDSAFDAIIDPVGGTQVGNFIQRLAPNGRYLLCGVAGGLPAAEFGMDIVASFQRSLGFETFSLDAFALDAMNATYSEIFGAAASRRLLPVIDGVLPLHDAAVAHKRLESGDVFGKLVLVP